MEIYVRLSTITAENGGRTENFEGSIHCFICSGDNRPMFPCEIALPFYRSYYPGDRMEGVRVLVHNDTFSQFAVQHQKVFFYENEKLIATGIIERIEQ